MTTKSKGVSVATARYAAPIHLWAAKDESRPILTGVLFEGTTTGLRIVAADGFRMATYTNSVPGDEFKVVVPGAFAARLWKQASKRKAFPQHQVLHILDGDEVGYIDADTGKMVTCEVIQGKFPDYTRILAPVVEKALSEQTRADFQVALNPEFIKGVGDFFRKAEATATTWAPGGTATTPQLFLSRLGADKDSHELLSLVVMPMFTPKVELDKLEDWVTTRNMGLRAQVAKLEGQVLAKEQELATQIEVNASLNEQLKQLKK